MTFKAVPAKIRGLAAVCAGAIILAGAAHAQRQQDRGEALSGEEIRAELDDAELYGCYPDGSPWGERTASDGALYDMLDEEAHVGRWWVADDIVCYSYFAAPQILNPSCFQVQRRERHLDFMIPSTGQIGGSTDCGQEIVRLDDHDPPAAASARLR